MPSSSSSSSSPSSPRSAHSPPPASPSPPPSPNMSALVHPAGKRFLMRKSSNTENMPPTITSAGHAKKAEALVSAREASRRRRARVVSGSLALRKIVQNAQRKASKAHNRPAAHIKLESVAEHLPSPCDTQQTTTAPAIQAAPAPQSAAGPSVEFPRWLPRPANFPQAINRANIDACSEGVHGVPHQYILNGLETAGPSMWHLVQNAQFDSQKFAHNLPQELQVVIADYTMWAAASPLPQSFPTHVLAVWENANASAGAPGANAHAGRRKVRLVPVHNLVLAANCANWFPMPAPQASAHKRVIVNNGGAPGTALTLPVVPLAVPHVESFHQLLYCLYTHKVSKLLDQLVPVARPPFVLPSAANPKPANMHYIRETGRRLAARYNPWAIVGMLQHVIGLWKNACYLGVSDRRLWLAIDWSWDMLLTGLAYAVGRPEIVPRPEPKVFKTEGASPVLQQQQPSQRENLQQPIRFEGLNRFVIPPPEVV